jgi:hypothetical protein
VSCSQYENTELWWPLLPWDSELHAYHRFNTPHTHTYGREHNPKHHQRLIKFYSHAGQHHKDYIKHTVLITKIIFFWDMKLFFPWYLPLPLYLAPISIGSLTLTPHFLPSLRS